PAAEVSSDQGDAPGGAGAASSGEPAAAGAEAARPLPGVTGDARPRTAGAGAGRADPTRAGSGAVRHRAGAARAEREARDVRAPLTAGGAARHAGDPSLRAGPSAHERPRAGR